MLHSAGVFELLTDYKEYAESIGDPRLNCGLVNKCVEAKYKGICTDVEGIIIKSMSMPSGLTKKVLLQNALRTLADVKVPLDPPAKWMLPQLLQYAKDHCASGKKKNENARDETALVEASTSSASPSAACAAASGALAPVATATVRASARTSVSSRSSASKAKK